MPCEALQASASFIWCQLTICNASAFLGVGIVRYKTKSWIV